MGNNPNIQIVPTSPPPTYKADNNSQSYVDNTVQIYIPDPKQVTTWEVAVLQNGKMSEFMLLFARYLCRGKNLVSPNLPNKSLDDLTKEETEMIKESEAYNIVKNFNLPELKGAATSFDKQALAGF